MSYFAEAAGDMPRRSYGIRLDANEEQPWKRKDFKIRDLEQYVHDNRGDLLGAALTVVRAWYTNGRVVARRPPKMMALMGTP